MNSLKDFNHELSLLKNFEGVTFANFDLGQLGQKCYYFLISENAIENFDIRMQGSTILNNIKPSKEKPFSSRLVEKDMLLITDFFDCKEFQ